MCNNFLNKIILILVFLFFPLNVIACNNEVNIYLFHSNSCFHCKEEVKMLNKLEKKYSNINVYKFEIHDANNKEMFFDVLDIYGIKNKSVPFLIIGDSYYIGYNEESSKLKIIKTIDYYTRYGYDDKVSSVLGVKNNNLEICDVKDNQISVLEFLDSYHNYKIIGNIYTDDISLECISILTSILSEFNLFNFVSIFLLVLIVSKIKVYKDKFMLVGIYLFSYFFVYILMMFNYNNYFLVLVFLLVLVLGFFFRKKRMVVYSLILGVTNNFLRISFYNRYVNIYLNVLNLNKLSILEIAFQYFIYIFFVFCCFLLFLFIIKGIYNKIDKGI